MEFKTLDDVHKMYNEYAKEVWFSVRKSKSWKRFGEPYMKYFSCSKEGLYNPDTKSGKKKRQHWNERNLLSLVVIYFITMKFVFDF